jgi:deoxyribodipyrimidine photo-lyase
MIALWWIRRDLRLSDNPALQAALQQGGPVAPVFILDPHLLERTPARRQSFLFDGLRALDADLRERGSSLDFTPYARARDTRIAASLPLTLLHGQTVHHPLVVHKADGAPYTVFTPFSKAWKALLNPNLAPLPAPESLSPHPFSVDSSFLNADNSIRLSASISVPESAFPAGEAEAQRRLAEFASLRIYQYSDTRNRMDIDGTSSLSPYLRFGMLSMRQAVCAALKAAHRAQSSAQKQSAETWLNELIWREFYISILYHFPHVSKRAFNPALAKISWREAESDFAAWKDGITGMPIVDAAMRQLSATGWMHNRARMIVASYLVKDLLINWQWGERWFMDHLLDGDPAANNGGWQWTAGTGTDAAPYFRIFNPVFQSRKFDPNGDYIRKWVHELAHLSDDAIHVPWEKGVSVPGYPSKPIMDHALVKERTLAAYGYSKSVIESRK